MDVLVLSSSNDDWTVKMEVSSSNELTVDGVLLLSGDEKGESVPSEIALRAFTTEVSMESRHPLPKLRGIHSKRRGKESTQGMTLTGRPPPCRYGEMTVAPEGGLLHSPTANRHGAHGDAIPARVEAVNVVLVVLDADGVGLPQNRPRRSTSAKEKILFPRAPFPVPILLDHHDIHRRLTRSCSLSEGAVEPFSSSRRQTPPTSPCCRSPRTPPWKLASFLASLQGIGAKQWRHVD